MHKLQAQFTVISDLDYRNLSWTNDQNEDSFYGISKNLRF